MSVVRPELVLRAGDVLLKFDPMSGVLTTLQDTGRKVDLVQEARLAENWRLLLPLPDLRDHYLIGSEQDLSSAEQDEDSVTLTWRGLTSAEGSFDVTVTQTWTVQGSRVSVVTSIDNGTDHHVEEVLSPALGGLAQRRKPETWRLHHSGPLGAGTEFPLFTDFPGTYLGPRQPVWVLSYHTGTGLPFVDVYDESRRVGVYLGVHDPEGSYATCYMQLKPGSNYRGDRQVWPSAEVLGPEVPIGATLGWSQFPFLAPRSSATLAPVVVEFHDGIWYEAARIFRDWWDAHFSVAPRTWLRDEDAWQSTIISYPDGRVEFRYDELVELARAAAESGINVIQVCGWHNGGLDRNYPDYSTDPRLGTDEEFTRALAECEALGVKVLVFGNLQVASVETDEWENLRPYAIQDPRGIPYNTMSWDYNTTTGVAGQSGYRMHWMNPAHPEFRSRWLAEMRTIVERGAAGIQVDKLLGGGFHGMDYNPDAPRTPSTSVGWGLATSMRELFELGRAQRPDFALGSESHWDRVVQTSSAAYARFFSDNHLPTFAVTFPEYKQTCCVTGPHDFSLVNNAIRYGHIISLEPECMHGSARSVPVLAGYVKAVLRLRRGLRELIWDSRLVDRHSWTVEGDVSWTVHESLADPTRRALVLNHFSTTDEQVTITPPDAVVATATVHRPFQEPQVVKLPGGISVGADEVVVVVPATSGEQG